MITEDDNYKTAHDIITKAKTIAIVGHVRPDGDCVGSALALKSAYGKGKKINIYFDGEIPHMPYLDGFDEIKTALPDGASFESIDLLIIIDMSTADRMGELLALRAPAKQTICIDHHMGFNIANADVIISKPNYASCGEIIYEILESNNVAITKPIADALYTSVATDTGCFLYPSTTALTHYVAGKLVEYGCDLEKINYENFRVYDKRLLKGLGQVLKNLRIVHDGKIAYTILKKGHTFTASERHKYKQYITDIAGVRISILCTQEGRKVFHVSLRSHGDANVEAVARVFGGGGHKNAAGMNASGCYKTVIKQIVREAKKVI